MHLCSPRLTVIQLEMFYFFLELTINLQCSSYAPTDPILMVS